MDRSHQTGVKDELDRLTVIITQFILTPAGWKLSAMAWDDERPGLSLPLPYEPGPTGPT